MASRPSERSSRPGLAGAFERIFAESDAGRALVVAAGALVEACDARAAALWMIEDLTVTHHALWPAGGEMSPAVEPDVPALAARLLKTAPGAWTWLGGGTWRAAFLVLEAEGGRRAVACAWGGALAALDAPPPDDEATRLVALGVRHARQCAALARARLVESKSERWFKRLDDQIRVLDR